MKHFMNIHITKTIVRRQRSLHSPFSMCTIHVRWMRDCGAFICVIIPELPEGKTLRSMFVNWFMKPIHFGAGHSIVSGNFSLDNQSVLKSENYGFSSACRWRSTALHSYSFSLRAIFFILFAASVALGIAETGFAEIGFAQEPTVSPIPKSPVDQAEKLLDEGKPREALRLLTQIAEKDPKAPGLEGKLGKAYFQLRQFSQATPHLKNALQQNAADLESTQFLALSFYSAGNYREALPLLEKLGPRLPKNSPDSPYLLSICYVMTQQWDSARKVLAQMFFVPSDSAMAYLALGKLMVRQQMVDAAVPQIETALRLEPRLAMAHFLLGEIDLYQSNPQGAISEFQKELAVNPTVWLVYWRLGDAYMRLSKYDDAEVVLKKAIWLNEASPGAFILLGEIALKKNDPTLAAGFLERALAIDPQSFDAHYALATAYKALGREAEANQHFDTAKTLRNEKHDDEKHDNEQHDSEKGRMLPAP
jgi:tetratricopeptide (TPR) repeat protein